MNAAIKQEIMDAYRIGNAQIADIAKFYDCSEAYVEKLIFPQGRGRRLLPAVLPKVAKEVTTLFGADGIIRIPGEIRKLVPLSESRMKIVHKVRPVGDSVKEQDNRAGHTPSKAKTPEGRLGALKAWETMRKQKAEKNGEVYVPRTLEELKRLAGIHEDPKPEPVPEVKPETIVQPEPLEIKTQPVRPIIAPSAKDDDLDIDYKPVVEIGRVVSAYCSQHNITLKDLLDAHQKLSLINQLMSKPNQ